MKRSTRPDIRDSLDQYPEEFLWGPPPKIVCGGGPGYSGLRKGTKFYEEIIREHEEKTKSKKATSST